MGRGKRRGFTLLETVTAAVILAVAVPPMLWAVRAAQRHRVNPVLASRARWLAASRLEDLIADRHSASGRRGYGWLNEANYPDEGPGDIAGYPQFSRSVSFLEVDGRDLATARPGSGFMRATVTVGWTDAAGDARTLSVSAVITDYDPS